MSGVLIMNAYQEGVAAALGWNDVNVGTPDQLFYPANYKERLGKEYLCRKLSTTDVGQLLHVSPDTVNKWAREGKLPGRKGGKRRAMRYLPFSEGFRQVRSQPPYWNQTNTIACCEVGDPYTLGGADK